jgi:ribosomal protein S1
VELFPGVQGLVHISKFGKDRMLRHPKEVLKIGDVVTVRVIEIDDANQKISLTMEKEELDVSKDLEQLRKRQEGAKKSTPGPMANLFDEALKKK